MQARLVVMRAMTDETPFPRVWDLSTFFPRFDGREYRAFKAQLIAAVGSALRTATDLAPLPADTVEAAAGREIDGLVQSWAGIFLSWEELSARTAHVFCYVGCLGAANAADEAIQAEEAALELIAAELGKLGTQLLRGLRSANDAVFGRLLAARGLEGAAHTLHRLRAEAVYQMSPAEEALAADLGVTGMKAWGRLYETVTGKMTFVMEHPVGRRETVPMAQCRALMANPDRAIRRAAFLGGAASWTGAADTCAAVVNALAGTRHTLYARRGREHFLDAPLHDGALGRETLDAMFSAVSKL